MHEKRDYIGKFKEIKKNSVADRLRLTVKERPNRNAELWYGFYVSAILRRL